MIDAVNNFLARITLKILLIHFTLTFDSVVTFIVNDALRHSSLASSETSQGRVSQTVVRDS